MKNLLTIIFFTALISVNAQTKYFETEIQGLRSDLRDASKELMAENMLLSAEEAEIFWPLYDEYRAEMVILGDKEIALMEDFMLNYMAMEDADAKRILKDVIQLDNNKMEVRGKYMDKMSEVLPGKTVGRFYQLERRLNLLIDVEKASRFPLIKKDQ